MAGQNPGYTTDVSQLGQINPSFIQSGVRTQTKSPSMAFSTLLDTGANFVSALPIKGSSIVSTAISAFGQGAGGMRTIVGPPPSPNYGGGGGTGPITAGGGSDPMSTLQQANQSATQLFELQVMAGNMNTQWQMVSGMEKNRSELLLTMVRNIKQS